jgi:hypothetical protein
MHPAMQAPRLDYRTPSVFHDRQLASLTTINVGVPALNSLKWQNRSARYEGKKPLQQIGQHPEINLWQRCAAS